MCTCVIPLHPKKQLPDPCFPSVHCCSVFYNVLSLSRQQADMCEQRIPLPINCKSNLYECYLLKEFKTKNKILCLGPWLFIHTCSSSPSPLSALTKRHLLLSLPLQPAWLYKAGSSSRGLLYVSDGYGGRRHGRGRRSLDYYDDLEPEELTRVFVALFDYDPMSMSPNPDAADEELPFKEGQIIKVTRTYRSFRSS